MQFSATIPILRSFDETKAREFYIDFLGFTLDWEHRFADGMPLYIQVSRAGCRLHISEHHGDGSPGAAVFIDMIGLHDFHAELAAKDYPNLNPGIVEAPWNAWLMQLIDPFGNKLNFSQSKE